MSVPRLHYFEKHNTLKNRFDVIYLTSVAVESSEF